MKHCNIELSSERITALATMYKDIVGMGEASTDDELIYAHADDMRLRLKVMDAKEKNRGTLNLTVVECIAFERLWQNDPLDLDLWHFEIVRSCLAQINKFLVDKKSNIKKLTSPL